MGNLATRWTELLRRGGCQLPSLVLQKGGYVSLCAFSGRCSHDDAKMYDRLLIRTESSI
jgi:hypothetical protein